MANELVLVNIGGVDYGAWDTRTGGAQTRENTKRRRPTGGEVVYPGRKTVDDVTVSVVFRPVDRADLVSLVRTLNTTDGSLPMVVTRQPLDDNDQPFGRPLSVDTGWVATDNAGDYDVQTDEPQMLEVAMTVESRA